MNHSSGALRFILAAPRHSLSPACAVLWSLSFKNLRFVCVEGSNRKIGKGTEIEKRKGRKKEEGRERDIGREKGRERDGARERENRERERVSI